MQSHKCIKQTIDICVSLKPVRLMLVSSEGSVIQMRKQKFERFLNFTKRNLFLAIGYLVWLSTPVPR